MRKRKNAGKRGSNLDLSPAGAYGAASLRFVLAGFWIVHWRFKVGYRGMPATESFFMAKHLPAWLAWFDISFEAVAAACLLLGPGACRIQPPAWLSRVPNLCGQRC
jgi:uncharacterized membrane protein YphA (DoxX/SURF4 family)